MSSPQETKAAFSVLNQSNYQHVQEQRSPDITSAKKSEKCSDFTSQGGDAERVKGDDMAQVLEDDAETMKNDNMTQAFITTCFYSPFIPLFVLLNYFFLIIFSSVDI